MKVNPGLPDVLITVHNIYSSAKCSSKQKGGAKTRNNQWTRDTLKRFQLAGRVLTKRLSKRTSLEYDEEPAMQIWFFVPWFYGISAGTGQGLRENSKSPTVRNIWNKSLIFESLSQTLFTFSVESKKRRRRTVDNRGNQQKNLGEQALWMWVSFSKIIPSVKIGPGWTSF